MTYTAPLNLSSVGFSSIKVLIVLGHEVTGMVLLVGVSLALTSKHIKYLATGFYGYERTLGRRRAPSLIRC